MSTLSTSASAMNSNCPQCLICLKNMKSSQNSPGRLEKDALLIERQFSVVYLVNKLLEIPSEVCANYLSKFGNPEEWISICGDCSSLVGEGRQMFNKIKRLERKHKAIGEELRLKMKVKPEDEEQSILGQATFEIRHYLDTLDDLNEDGDFGTDKDDNWLILDENLNDSPQKLSKSKRKKRGRKRKSSRPKRNVSKSAKYSQETKFSEAEEEAEVELNLEENMENFEDEDPIGENFEDENQIEENFGDEDTIEENRKVEDPIGKCFKNSYFNIKIDVPPKKIEKNHQQSKSSRSRPRCQGKFVRRVDWLSHLRQFPKVELSAEEMAAKPLSFEDVLKKHEELVAKLETEPDQEGERANNKGSHPLATLARLAFIHKVKKFVCQGCRKLFLSFEGWDKHFNGEIGTCRQKAEERIKKAAAAAAKLAKKIEKNNNKNLSCPKPGCKSKFATRFNLYRHLRKHHKPKVELSAEEMAAEPLIFAQVLKKYEESVAELETEPDQEGQGSNKKEPIPLAHLTAVHKVKEFPCQVCAKVYKSFEGWNKHYNAKKGICRKKAESMEIPAAELKLKSSKIKPLPPAPVPGIFQNVSCPEPGCKNVFGLIKKLEYHIRERHLDKEELRCKGCSVFFKAEFEYDKHYSSALNSDPSSPCVLNGVKCGHGQCRHVYSSQAALEVHQKMRHAPERVFPRFKCLDCGQVLSSKSSLRHHIANKHDPSTIGLYPCPKPGCSKSFRINNNLQVHLKYYHGPKEGLEKKFKCHFENCTSAFVSNNRLLRHSKIHNPENPVVCEICGKGFKMQNYLTIHSWQHDPAMRHKYKEYRDNKLAKKRRLEQEQQASE